MGRELMRGILLSVAFVLACIGAALTTHSSNAMLKLIVNFQGGNSCSSTTYSGPGDVVSGAKVWLSLRAYSAAKVCTNAVNVARASDSMAQDIKTTANGDLDIAAANSFAGTDATCNASISGTTMTLQTGACSGGTLHVNDTLTGAGIVQPAYIVTIGTCGSNTSGNTCTLNASQTVSTETITAQVALAVSTIYDQTGALYCGSAACNATAITSSRPFLIPNCVNSLPCMWFTSRAGSPATPTGVWNEPFTYSVVANRIPSSSSFAFLVGYVNNGGCGSCAVGYFNAASKVGIFWNSTPSVTASDAAWHAFQFVVNNTSSVINVDNTASTVTSGTSNPGTLALNIGQNASGNTLIGYMTEVGGYITALSSGNQTSLCHSQFAYWATAASC